MSQEYKKYLLELTQAVLKATAAIDACMQSPESNKKGKRIAEICNFLEMANDAAMHFGLSYGFKKIANLKKKTEKTIKDNIIDTPS